MRFTPVLLSVALGLICIHAQAASFSVVVNDFYTVMKKRDVAVNADETLGAFTDRVLISEKASSRLDDYEGSDGGVVRIHQLGNQLVVLSDTDMKAYGWCFRYNGEVPELMPDKIGPLKDTDQIEWFYAYALMKGGKWVAQCHPLGREDLPEPDDSDAPIGKSETVGSST